MPVKPTPPEIRFWRHVNKTDDCWLWTGSTNNRGYGQFGISAAKRSVLAHRFSYEMAKGPIPVGLQINHLCEVKECVRPDHLEAVTPRENTLYGSHPNVEKAQRTHCPYGHPLDRYKTNGTRRCSTCGRERERRRRLDGPPCSVDQCSKIATKRGICDMHYMRERRGLKSLSE